MSNRSLTLGLARAAAPSVHAAPASSSAAAALAQEAPGTQPGTPQRSKMKACNADAKQKDLHGEERRKFMSHCLSGKPAAERS
jgi:hypothetical protein